MMGECCIHGMGVPMDFKKATEWWVPNDAAAHVRRYLKGGKDRAYADRKIKKKLDSLKPRYKGLFDDVNVSRSGVLTDDEFHTFYRCAMMAKGMSEAAAEKYATGTYQVGVAALAPVDRLLMDL